MLSATFLIRRMCENLAKNTQKDGDQSGKDPLIFILTIT